MFYLFLKKFGIIYVCDQVSQNYNLHLFDEYDQKDKLTRYAFAVQIALLSNLVLSK